MLEAIDKVVNAVSGFIYDPWVPLFLVIAGIVFTAATGFIQVRMLRESVRVVKEKPKTKGAVSSFGANRL